MKYVKRFDTLQDSNNFYKYSDETNLYTHTPYLEPITSCVNNDVRYNLTEYEKYYQQYFTLEILTSGTLNIKASNSVGGGSSNVESSKRYQFTKNFGESWTTKYISMSDNTIDVNAGDILQFRGTGGSGISKNPGIYSNYYGGNYGARWSTLITGTAEFNAYGNIGSLFYGYNGENWSEDNFRNATYDFNQIDNQAATGVYFNGFFTSTLISAKYLVLPKNGVFVNIFPSTAEKPIFDYRKSI